jgi:hypothetical protein
MHLLESEGVSSLRDSRDRGSLRVLSDLGCQSYGLSVRSFVGSD